jgi:hypothetical protein
MLLQKIEIIATIFCSTTVLHVSSMRSILLLMDKLAYHTANWDSTITFRNLIDEYSYDKRWENFGMNLLIGYPVDKPTTPREQQFLPDYLAKAITSATIAQDGKNTSL